MELEKLGTYPATGRRYLTQRIGGVVDPFESRIACNSADSAQLLLFEGRRPAAAMRFNHDEFDASERACWRPPDGTRRETGSNRDHASGA